MRKVFFVIYSLYALILFFIVLIPMALIYVIIAISPLNDRNRIAVLCKINYYLLGGWAYACFMKIEVEGAELLDKNQTYVIAGNHVNMLDIPLCGVSIQHYMKPLGKKEIVKVPLLGLLFQLFAVLVDRSNEESRKKSMDSMLEVVKTGCSIAMFPEGTRNRSDAPLKHFHSGAFRLAIRAQIPVIPFVQLGLRELQPVTTWMLYPGTIKFKYLPPISTKGMTEDDADALRDQVHQLIEDTLYKEDSYWSKVKR